MTLDAATSTRTLNNNKLMNPMISQNGRRMLYSFGGRGVAQAVEHSVKVWILLYGGSILHLQIGLFSVPTSDPQLVHQRLWYVLPCLWESEYKRSLAAYWKE